MVEVLKQPQYQPMDVSDQVITIFAGVNGFLDDVPVAKVRTFEQSMLKYIHEKHPDTYRELQTKAELTKEVDEKLRKVIQEFKKTFTIKS